MKKFAEDLLLAGGEGCILREPKSVYQAGKSAQMQKYKVRLLLSNEVTLSTVFSQAMRDNEALVIKILGNDYICKL
jgi:ATP-dependent DNA ligase